jgi:hypothetical protein
VLARYPIGIIKPFLIPFLLNPLSTMTERLLYYIPHLLHFGVPYWEPTLVNPALSVLAAIGLASAVESHRWKLGIILLSAGVILFTLLKELLIGPVATGALGVAIILITGAAVASPTIELIRSTDYRSRPLVTLAPYVVYLFVGYLTTRNLLPVALVLAPYAGKGTVLLLRYLGKQKNPLLERLRNKRMESGRV